jgi:hypothetical protein
VDLLVLLVIFHFRNHGLKRTIVLFNLSVVTSMLADRTVLFIPSAQIGMAHSLTHGTELS